MIAKQSVVDAAAAGFEPVVDLGHVKQVNMEYRAGFEELGRGGNALHEWRLGSETWRRKVDEEI